MEKPRSPAARESPTWVQDYQPRIEQASLEYQQLWAIEFQDEAKYSQGQLEMLDANSNIVQTQSSEIAQQGVHKVRVSNCTKINSQRRI